MKRTDSWTMFWIGFWTGVMFTMFGLLLSISNADAHDTAIVRCDRNLKVSHVIKLGEDMHGTTGLLAEGYDRNGDNVADIVALSHITGPTQKDGSVPHRENPVMWEVDLDFDGKVDKTFIDIVGEGRCEDIVLYLDHTAPLPEDMFHGTDPTKPHRTI